MLMEGFEFLWQNTQGRASRLNSERGRTKAKFKGLWGFLPHIAEIKGYTVKLALADAWRKDRAKFQRYEIIHFRSYEGGKIQIYETGIGCYEMPRADVRRLLIAAQRS